MTDHLPEASTADPDHDERVQIAAANKARFEGAVRGAQARAEMLPRSIISQLAYGVSAKMLVELIRGTYKPKSAKEAADIAKITYELARRESGESDLTITITTPEERAKALETLRILRETALARAGMAPTAALTSGAAEPIYEAELVEDEPADAGLIPRSAAVRTGPAMMRLVRTTTAKEA